MTTIQRQESPTNELETVRNRSVVRPRIDLYGDDAGYTVRAELPGVREENLDLKFRGNLLTLQAHSALEEPAGMRPVYREFEPRAFACTFSIPDDVDPNLIEAGLKNGLLTVEMGKRAEVKPRKIQVKTS